MFLVRRVIRFAGHFIFGVCLVLSVPSGVMSGFDHDFGQPDSNDRGLKQSATSRTRLPRLRDETVIESDSRRDQLDEQSSKKDEPPPAKPANTFTVTSPAFADGGKYPVEFTGDGDGVSPPLAWSGAPEGTKFYALQLWHKPFPDRDEVKSYWVITNIPATATKLEKNTKGVGKDGYHDKNRTGYDPMKSKGPGVKEYHITMYALSAEPKFRVEKVTRAELLAAIKDITLAQSTINYKYERGAK